jgi:hypothetical protein
MTGWRQRINFLGCLFRAVFSNKQRPFGKTKRIAGQRDPSLRQDHDFLERRQKNHRFLREALGKEVKKRRTSFRNKGESLYYFQGDNLWLSLNAPNAVRWSATKRMSASIAARRLRRMLFWQKSSLKKKAAWARIARPKSRSTAR